MVRVAVDAMGGDNAPKCMVEGAVNALAQAENIQVLLVGNTQAVEQELSGKEWDKNRLKVVPAASVISTDEPPVEAIRKKKDSSMVIGLNMIRNGEADAFVSCGSTGALLVGGQTIAGRVKGVKRPPLAALIPTTEGVTLLADSGANVDARPEHLVSFARMGSIYMSDVLGVKNPRVGLLNIGAEEEKGNALTKETYQILKGLDDLNFIGNIEARDVPYGKCDVLVCDAFAGNIALKMYEGVATALLKEIKSALYSSLSGKLGGLLIKPSLKGVLKKFDATAYGGAPLLGLRGLVVKAHGSATEKEVCNAILQCVSFTEAGIAGKIEKSLTAEEEE